VEVIRVTKPYELITLDLRPEKTVVRVDDAMIGDSNLAIIGEAKSSPASNFLQTLPVRLFRLKASQHELLDPSAAQLGLPSAENQQARDWLARFLCRAH